MTLHYKAILAITAAALSLAPAPLLRRELKPGTTDEYDIKCVKTSIPPEGVNADPQMLKATWKAAYSVESVDPEKGAQLKVEIRDFALSGTNLNVTTNQPKDRTITAFLDSRNRITEAKSGDKPMPTNMGWLVTDSLELPEGEVGIGDTWDVSLPASSILGNSKLVLPAKLTGEDTYEGLPAWTVVIDKKDVDSQDDRIKRKVGDGPLISAKAVKKSDVYIKALIEKATGRVLLMTAKVHQDQKIFIDGDSDPGTANFDYTSTMKLKVAKA